MQRANSMLYIFYHPMECHERKSSFTFYLIENEHRYIELYFKDTFVTHTMGNMGLSVLH